MAVSKRWLNSVSLIQLTRRTPNLPLWSGLNLLLFGLLISGIQLHAQQSTPITLDVNAVNVIATVHDKHENIIRNLTKDDFVLEQDGKPQTVTYFAKESDLPLTLGLLIDTSMSQRRVLDQERAASRTFLDQVLREDKDKAFVIQFDREVTLLQDLTSSRQKLQAAIDKVDAPEFSQPSSGGSQSGGGSGGSGGGGAGAVVMVEDGDPTATQAALFSMTRSTWRPKK